MNLRPSGYEPDELPDCSTPHQEGRAFYKPDPRAAIPKLAPQIDAVQVAVTPLVPLRFTWSGCGGQWPALHRAR